MANSTTTQTTKLTENLKTISDEALIANLDSLVREEREILTNVLYHLLEVNRRRLYSSLKYKSLFDYAVRRLGYPEDQAYRRIAAMKLLVALPAIEEKINDGGLNLTHLSLANSLFNSEKKNHGNEFTPEQKLGVFELIAHKPVREAELLMLSMSSSPAEMKPETVKPLTADRLQLKFTVSAELKTKMDRLKGMLAHKYPGISMEKLMEVLCDMGLEEFAKAKEAKRKSAAPKKLRVSNSPKGERGTGDQVVSKAELSKAALRRAVFARANHACENCQSEYALEMDHNQPLALGGKDTFENLRVLCRSCNQRAAIEVFGAAKITQYPDTYFMN